MRAVGIDLGTTNTVIAGNAAVLPLRFGTQTSTTMPSVVAYLPDGTVSVGAAARERRAIDVANTIYSSKRVIGEPWRSPHVREFGLYYPFEVLPIDDGKQLGFKTRAGVFSPMDIASLIVRTACAAAEIDPSQLEAVVTIPAAFSPAQRAATIRAVEAAGFKRAHSVLEPIATTLAYLNRTDVRHGVVYDLGGGTFDLAVLDCSRTPFRIIAHGGDPYLGGDDIDHGIAGFVADTVLRQHGWDLRSDPQVFARLVLEAERAKVRLTAAPATELDLQQVDPAAPPAVANVPLSRSALMELSEALIRRTFSVCDEVLSSARLTASDVQAVFLAGGTTLVPGVREAVARYFGKKLRYELDPMHVVGIGASIAAARPGFASVLDNV